MGKCEICPIKEKCDSTKSTAKYYARLLGIYEETAKAINDACPLETAVTHLGQLRGD